MTGRLLDRSRSLEQARPVIELVRPALIDAVDHGTIFFGRLMETRREDEVQDERLAILSAYLMLIEMLDGVEVLLAGAAAAPARLLLRTQFEAMLTIDYILREDTRRRALAWVVCHVHRRISTYRTHDPTTPAGAEYKQEYADDVYTGTGAQPIIDSSGPVASLQTMLALPHLQESEAEHERLRRLGRKFSWYTFYDGPRSLRELAKRCRRGAQYDLLYREWSKTGHADDLHRQLMPSTGEGIAIRVLRETSELRTIAQFALSFFLDVTRTVMNYYRPDDVPAWRVWYKERIQGPYMQLTNSMRRR